MMSKSTGLLSGASQERRTRCVPPRSAVEALITAVSGEPWFGGFHWWMWFAESSDSAAALSYMPEGKPAGDILEVYWAETSS
jgi:hypothetical protein